MSKTDNTSENVPLPENVRFVYATPVQLAASAQAMHSHFIEQFGGVPVKLDGDVKPVGTFKSVLGWDRQPTPIEYFAYVDLLLTENGVSAAKDVVTDNFAWIFSCYGEGIEPIAMANALRHPIS
jgi:hypothetical protein